MFQYSNTLQFFLTCTSFVVLLNKIRQDIDLVYLYSIDRRFLAFHGKCIVLLSLSMFTLSENERVSYHSRESQIEFSRKYRIRENNFQL